MTILLYEMLCKNVTYKVFLKCIHVFSLSRRSIVIFSRLYICVKILTKSISSID